MEEKQLIAKYDIVSILVPFTDLSNCKVRPAIILAVLDADIIVACITSKINGSKQAGEIANIFIPVAPSIENGLSKLSYVQLSKIITLDKSLISCRLGRIDADVLQKISTNLFDFFKV